MNSLRNLFESVAAWLGNEAHRAYLYTVLGGLGALLQVYGLVNSTQLAAWLGFAALALGVGMARANVTTKPKRIPTHPSTNNLS